MPLQSDSLRGTGHRIPCRGSSLTSTELGRRGVQARAGCLRLRRLRARARRLALAAARSAHVSGPRTIPALDEPADKLYNEGLYLLNEQEGPQGGGEEVRRGRPPAPLFRLGAQVADHVGLRLLRGGRLRRMHQCRATLRHPASRQPGRGLCAVPHRLAPISTRYRTSRATRTAPRRRFRTLEEVARKYPNSEYAVAAKKQDRDRARSARRQGDATSGAGT